MATMLETGHVLQGRYRIDGLLGKGGMGAVYRAHDLRLNCTVAIKENLEFDEGASHLTELAPGSEPGGTDGRRAQFEREAQMLARMRHEGLPKVTDHFLIPGQGQYLVMEFVQGKDLSEIMTERGRLEVHDAIRIAIDVCRVLEYLHAQKPPIIHRDLKPANLRLTPDGRLIVVDFGIAKEGGSGLTRTGALGVTPGFSPVEQYAGTGQSDARSDVYALGATLYALLSGQTPPAATDRFVGKPVIPLQEKLIGASRHAQAVVDRAMALNPVDRYASATLLREALEQALSGTSAPDETVRNVPGLTAPIVPVRNAGDTSASGDSGTTGAAGGPESDPTGQRRRRSFFDHVETEPVDSVQAAPGATGQDAGDARRTPGAMPGDSSAAAAGSAVSAEPGAVAAGRDGQKPPRGRRGLTIAALALLLLGAFGYAAYRLGYLPPSSSPVMETGVPAEETEAPGAETASLLWTSIEVHLSDDPEFRPSAANLLERIDASSGPVRTHAAIALLSDRDLAGRTFDGDPLASIVRSRTHDLECGRQYRAIAVGTRGDGSQERLGSAQFLSDPCSGSAPGGLTAVDIGAGALTLRWEWGGEGFVAYEVHHSKDAILSPSPLTRTGEALGSVEPHEQRITGLDCDTEYTFLVRVVTETGSADSTPLRVRTASCASANVSDTPPVTVPPRTTDSAPVTTPPARTGSAPASDPTPGTGSAPASDPPVPIETTPALAPVRLDPPVAKSGTAVALRWSPSPSALFSGYDVHLSVTPGFTPSPGTKVQTVSMIDQSTLELADLACNTTYYFRIVVRDIKAQSAVSDLASVTTPACAIPNPVRLSPAGGGDFPDLLTAFEKINRDPNVPDGLRIELAPGTYSFAGDLWIGKSVVLDGPQANLEGRIVLQAPRIELIGLTLDTSGKSALNVPSGKLFLKDCTIISRTHPGIEVLNNGSVEMRNTTVRDCGSKGLLLRGQARALVQGGSIEANESGIDVGGNAQLTMHGTRVTRSRQSGVYIHDNGSATIDQSAAINGNGLNGILVAAGARLDLSGSQVRENQQAGIIVESGGTARLRDCDLTGNSQDALIEDPGSTVAREGQVRVK